jgi:hypothetical protein
MILPEYVFRVFHEGKVQLLICFSALSCFVLNYINGLVALIYQTLSVYGCV